MLTEDCGQEQLCGGLLFVMSAPSGAGKTTLGRLLLEREAGLRHSISYTTRAMRRGERAGVDYHFVDQDTFQRMIDNNDFVEWAKVHGNYYGTSLADILQLCAEGRDVLLDIDVQGAEQLRARGVDAVFIFIVPPNMEILSQRLQQRDSDTHEVIAKRMVNARRELEHAPRYDYIIINDRLEEATQALHAIIRAEHNRARRVMPKVRQLGT
ncbi:MAG: guanylate kinase [Desulfuromonadaceae bacterium]|nr:guanylate kinase [Desulfuromonadaceae bacterium]